VSGADSTVKSALVAVRIGTAVMVKITLLRDVK
jgi:hypothetical protein